MIHSKEIQSQIKVFKQIFLRSVFYKLTYFSFPERLFQVSE